MVIPILMCFSSFVSNWSIASRIKPHVIQRCDIINDVKLFPTVYHRIYCRKFLTLSNQMSRYKIKCIRIFFLLHVYVYNLTLCIQEPPKHVLLQTVKNQIKCYIMRHFSRVYTVCKGKNDLQTKEYNFYENYNLTALDMYVMDYPKFIVSN